ncbi:hypothetical protein ACFLS9_06005 [Bacteroidota bacterium]
MKTNINFNLIKEFLLGLSVIVIITACSTSQYGIEVLSDDELIELENRINADTGNVSLLKDFALKLLKAHKHDKAEIYFERAILKMPDDPAVLFSKGLNHEFLEDTLNALQEYAKYPSVPVTSSYRDIMQGRFILLNRKVVQREIKDLVKDENKLDLRTLDTTALAIFPIDYLGSDDKYSPLGRGLSEMISIDLGKVKRLKILERIRLNSVTDELAFSQSDLVDPTSAPRVGKLLSAGLIYSGSFNVTDRKDLDMQLSHWNIVENQRGESIIQRGDISDLFVIEKEVVFRILNQLEISLTPLEREEIEFIPTKNLDAFLAYSKGLELEDEGNYDGALNFFRNALELDPKLGEVSNKIRSSSGVNTSSVNNEQMLEVVDNIEMGVDVLSDDQFNLINERLETLGSDIRSGFSQGMDQRQPAQEAAGVRGFGELPPPPPPPNL